MLPTNTLGWGTARSCIRELFEYGLARKAVIGEDNVYDFSLGNPSIPAPDCVNETIAKLITGDSVLYSTTWLLFPYCLTVEEHNASLHKLKSMQDRFDTLLTGHTLGLQPASILDDLIEGSDAILAGKTDRAGIYNFGEHKNLPCYYYGEQNAPLVYREGFVYKK